MADFILTVIAALVVGGIGFGLFSFVAGRDPGLAEPVPDGVGDDPLSAELIDGPSTTAGHLAADGTLAGEGLLSAEGLEASRFDVAIRGYRMNQVDALMARAARTIRDLEDRVADLEDPRAPEPASAERASAEPASAERASAETAADPAR
ncbi:MAG: DivIVA protein [Actinomycetia bacterium]|nr:DivIVA protein [Actinomycetes bacterium]